MSNAINRQMAADYDYDVDRWRQAVGKYNTNVETYNAQLDAYKASGRVVTTGSGKRATSQMVYSAPPPDRNLIANKPDEADKPTPPTFTTQQLADMGKSDTPMVDAAMNEQSNRSAFGALPGRSSGETGLIARALKGFK